MTDHKALFEKLTLVLNESRYELMPDVYTDDYVDEYPQSGEVIRGIANVRAMLDHYPGREDSGIRGSTESIRIEAADGFKAVAPSFTLVRVEKTGDKGVATVRARYPDGSYWWIVLVYELRGGRIAHSRSFFAPDFPAPAWRKPFVEPTPAR